jgi:hypothetical protein
MCGRNTIASPANGALSSATKLRIESSLNADPSQKRVGELLIQVYGFFCGEKHVSHG